MEKENDNISACEEIDDKKIIKVLRFHRIININAVRTFFVVFFAIAIIALIPTLRPEYSESEKRNLAKFPKFTFDALISGDFFDDVNIWFSDTFPFRDALVNFNSYLNGMLDTGNVEVHGEVEKGDDIPDIKPTDDTTSTPPITEPPKIEEPTGPAVEKLGAIIVIDNAAYEYYNFNEKTSQAYAAYINRAAVMLKGKANVYDIIVPTSMGITAPKDIIADVNTSDQKKAIQYMYSLMSEDVKTVELYDTLQAHKDEYIYFRTDHHWTALGAYYAYCNLMNEKGEPAAPLSQFTERQFPGYLGSFYSASQKSPKLAATPDTVYAYEPKYNTTTIYYEDGTIKDTTIIADGNQLGTSSKYLSFIHGDRPLCVMKNPDITDGSVCVVIKESFGNAFVPFLTENYGTVYVVDYRYFSKIDSRTLSQFVDDTGAQDVVFINNISATRNNSLVTAIGGFVGEIPVTPTPEAQDAIIKEENQIS